MMNRTKFLWIAFVGVLLLSSCSSDDDTQRGNWVERSVFDGTPRSSATGFLIDNKGYLGTGYDGDDYLNDFWEYDMDGDFWVQKADFPGIARSSASGFAIANKGYLGVGYDGDNELGDFWEYNPSANMWTQKASFEGGVRRGAVSFAVNGTGYIGTGYDGDNDRKDFWKYDATTDQWTELVGFGGAKRRDATTFTLNGKVYLGTGVSNGIYEEDFWEFDPTTEVWTKKDDLDEEDDEAALLRANAVGFAIGGRGYIATGYNFGALGSLWEYNVNDDSWEEITAIEGTNRQDAFVFTNENRAVVVLGRSGNLYLDDAYEVFPLEEYDEED